MRITELIVCPPMKYSAYELAVLLHLKPYTFDDNFEG